MCTGIDSYADDRGSIARYSEGHTCIHLHEGGWIYNHKSKKKATVPGTAHSVYLFFCTHSVEREC